MVRALYIPSVGTFYVRRAQMDKTGQLLSRVKLELPKPDDIVGDGRAFGIILKGHEIKDQAAGDLMIAYWPEIWEDRWGQDEVDLFLKNEKKRQGVR